MDKRHLIGDSAFAAEMQMQPKRFSFALNITPHDVIKKACDIAPLQIPDGFVFVAASTDLNLSYALTTVLIGFRPDGTAHLIWHQITPCRIDSRLPEAEYSNAVIRALTALGKQLRAFGIKIDGWGIDASGTPFEAVVAFCKSSVRLCGISACPMTGRASHIFTPFFRSRLRDEIKKTVLCGDAQEHVKAGAGKKWMVWDSDHYRELAQKAILAAHGASGGLTLYRGDSEEHVDFANQICNERLIMI